MPRRVAAPALAVACAGILLQAGTPAATRTSHPPAPADEIFADDFSRGLDRWQIIGVDAVTIHDSGDAAHGPVLRLRPNGDALALIRGSDAWDGVRVEGEMYFPTDIDNYLGLAYHAAQSRGRWDFGLVYVKGNNGYLQRNPHRDFNVSRTLYPEYRTSLTGPSAVETGRWQRFAYEVLGSRVHVYVGDTDVPQMTLDDAEGTRGRLGLQPRSVGGDVWVDNVRVRRLSRLSYDGPPVPDVRRDRRGLITDWRLAGPFERTNDDIARRPEAYTAWVVRATDPRGAVVTGRDVDYHGPRAVAYYRTIVRSASARNASLVLSTVDDLAVWLNGRFHWFVPRQDAAWHDAATNPAHAGRRVPLELREGDNELVLRVRGGVYASGGFYAVLVD